MKLIKNLKGYEHIRDIYYITEDGKVFSYGNYGSKVKGKKKELKQYVKTNNYLNVALMTEDATTKYIRVHRLVALAYIPNLDNKPYVNHIDKNRQNNHYENLEWVTPHENNLHSMAKKVYVYTLDGKLEKTYNYARECLNDGYNQGWVCAVARGIARQHKNRYFSYEFLLENEVVQRLSKPYPRHSKKDIRE